MATHYSSYFKIPHSLFEDKGVFDGFIDKDARLHLEPLRLRSVTIPEFKDTYQEVFLKYFDRFVLFVEHMEKEDEDDTFFNLIVEHLSFPEIPNVGLGYSEEGGSGKGMSGIKTTKRLAHTTAKIIKAGMKDPELFLFMHLFEKNVGADRISDMSIFILRPQILAYTQRIATELGLPVSQYKYDDVVYNVPMLNGEPLHLLPATLLADLPQATSYDDISKVDNYNNEIKRKVCRAVNGEWKDFSQGTNKKDVMKNAIINHRNAYDAVIDYLRSLSAKPYDFGQDDKQLYFDARLQEIVENALKGKQLVATVDDILNATRDAILLYKDCIENHRSYKLMYYEKDKITKSEDYAQEMLYMVAKAYLSAKGYDIDVSPEADTGVGKLDFKFSQGSHAKVIVETKLSYNDQLLHGYVKQLPDYMNSEHTTKGIYVVVVVNSKDNKTGLLKKLQQIENNRVCDNSEAPEIIFVNATERNTASKTK